MPATSVLRSGAAADYIEEFESQRAAFGDFARGLTAAQLEWQPPSGRWSIAQHLDHLAITTQRYLVAVGAAVDEARAAGRLAPPPYRFGWFGRMFARSMEPPPRFRVRTLRYLQPAAAPAPGEAVAALDAAFGAALDAVRGAEGVDLGRAKMRSPFFRLVTMSLGTSFDVILAHNRRHRWLMREVTEHADFPVG